MGWGTTATQGLVARAGDLIGWPVPIAVGAVTVGGAGDEEPSLAASDPALLNGLFEIGSVTKTITATLLALAVGDGLLTLHSPIGTWLDAGANASITVGQLATHTSGLPRLAPNALDHVGFQHNDPYAAFTQELALQGLRSTDLAETGGEVYSNFGYQLLGLVLERATSRTYAALLAEEVAGPR